MSDSASATSQSAPALPGAHAIFDTARFHTLLDEQLAGLTDHREIRAATVQAIAASRAEAMDDILSGFDTHPRAARETVRAIAALTDAVVRATHHVAVTRLHPQNGQTTAERLAVIAVGGYGRAEMAPHSDVDLLFLTPHKSTGWAESVVESILYMLWDLKLKVGQSTRSVAECLRLGEADMTIRTSLLEHRLVCGDAVIAEELRSRLWPELFERTVPQFIEAKLAEREARHLRQGGQRYVLEPNVKEGKGGLRDLQTLYWIAKYIHRVDRAVELVDLGFFTRDEHATFWQAEDFMWAVRCHLHLITGRAVDTLSFDLQLETAQRMGYHDAGGRRAVEIFMQDYFRHATRVGELTRVFLTALEARHLFRAPLIGVLRRKKRLRPGFKDQHGRLDIGDPAQFVKDPLNILRLFAEALRTGLLLHPEAMRLVAANLDLIDDDVRSNPEAVQLFLELLFKHGTRERALRRMNELGVLGAFIPEFERIVAMMQFNVYHHYTVDEHLIQCMIALAAIEQGEETDDLPLVTRIMRDKGTNRRVIYLAVLLHDIGKGLPEDHSIVGARLARRICVRLGLPQDEVETIEWLVRNHLLMSDVAQKRDISDPRTLRDFAKAVKSRRRLDLLTVLTVCDIKGVGPGTWNNWKAVLLRKLYDQTVDALENGLEEANREKRVHEARRSLRHQLAAEKWEPKAIRSEVGRHYDNYWQGLPTETQRVFADLLDGISGDEIRIDLHPDLARDATRAAFVLADHPGIFSRLAGALALVGANVVDARTYTTRDGFATAVFWVQDEAGRPYASDRLDRLRRMIDRTLAGEVVPREALVDRDKLKKRDRAFRFPTHVTFDNEGSEIYTIIEVDTRDRPGLLYDVTRTLAANHIQIVSAVIATYGAQVVDSFYVKDAFGLKLHQQSRRDALEKKLRQAIREGADRADRPPERPADAPGV